MKKYLDLLARIFISIYIFFKAYDSIAYFKDTKIEMASFGITWRQDLLLIGAITLLIIGGLLILTGYRAKFGALLIFIYWFPISLITHSFWNDPPDIFRTQAILLMADMALCGALLLIMAHGSGEISIKRLFATFKVPQRKSN